MPQASLESQLNLMCMIACGLLSLSRLFHECRNLGGRRLNSVLKTCHGQVLSNSINTTTSLNRHWTGSYWICYGLFDKSISLESDP